MEKELNDILGLDLEDTLEDEVSSEEDESQVGVVDQLEGEVTDEGMEDDSIESVANSQQSRDINHIAAAARKNAEAERDKAREELLSRDRTIENIARQLRNAGYTGTLEDIIDGIEAEATGVSRNELKDRRQAEEERLKELVDNHPSVIAAEEEAQRLAEQRNKEMFDRELKNIQRINPEIKTIADLNNLGEHQDLFDTLIRGGMHIDKAYTTIFKGIAANSQKVDTKSHIQTVNSKAGQGRAVIVPPEERAMMKELMPNLTDKEIDEWYRKKQK